MTKFNATTIFCFCYNANKTTKRKGGKQEKPRTKP